MPHRARGSEGTAYIDKQGGRFVVRWWSDDERRYYTVKQAPTLEEAQRWAEREGFNVVVLEPHGKKLGEAGHPKPLWPTFVDQYLETALWASNDLDTGVPLDEKYGVEDFAQVAIDQAVAESNDFIKANLTDLEAVGDPSQHGHDFWLTRNHHGAGYWDRDYPKAISDRLTQAAHAAGERYVYAGDDGKLYFG